MTLPLEPLAALTPEATTTNPEFPDKAVPELRTTTPLLPELDTNPEPTITAPLSPTVLLPELNTNNPLEPCDDEIPDAMVIAPVVFRLSPLLKTSAPEDGPVA